jgi:hypothetical protein
VLTKQPQGQLYGQNRNVRENTWNNQLAKRITVNHKEKQQYEHNKFLVYITSVIK